MSNLNAFDIHNCPLTGKHLIEASAGTGKTYTLVNLYLRLLFERQLLPSQVLVVTFTEAATQEMTQRLREALLSFDEWLYQEALELSSPQQALYEQIQARALQHWASSVADLQQHSLRIGQSFDSAPISTIHSYCQQRLQRYALHSRSAFQFQLDKDEEAQVLQTVADYWRQTFYGKTDTETGAEPQAHPLLPLLLEQKLSPESLTKSLKTVFENPNLECIPAPEPVDLSQPNPEQVAHWHKVVRLWQSEQDSILGCVNAAIDQGHLNGRSYTLAKLSEQGTILHNLLGDVAVSEAADSEATDHAPLDINPDAEARKALDFFSAATLRTKTNKNKPQVSETHAFFEAVEALNGALQAQDQDQENAIFCFYQDLITHVRASLRQEKSLSHRLNFQDLLIQLAEALAPGPAGDTLARLLHQEMPVALIDEFQDTDTWQYQIFSRIYAEGDLFLIGDPKQSIYRFRGADLQVYLQARHDIPEAHRWTLDTNYRSSPHYIAAMNHFFTHGALHPQPFGVDEIQYVKVKAGKTQPAAAAQNPALYLWYAPFEAGQKAPDKYDFERQLVATVVEGVYQELQQGTPAKDITILVGKHYQSEVIGRALQKRQIPHLIHGQQNVFTSREAEDMVLFLQAILNPREALAPLFSAYALGYTAAEIADLQANEDAWVNDLEACHQLRQRWHRYGFFAMWSQFIESFEIYKRSLQFQHGERAITNFRQLSHLIQEAVQQQDLSPEHTLLWLQRQILSPSTQQDEQLLHLASEQAAVQIMTMHNSKGLEFPVVFCPFLWVNPTPRLTLPFKVTLDNGQTVMEMGSEAQDDHKKRAKQQELEVQLRLSYVALTRASERCHVYWGSVARTAQSALHHYLNIVDQKKSETLAIERLQALGDSPFVHVAPFLSPQQTRWHPPESPQPTAPLTAYTARLKEAFQNTSFTRLSAQRDDEEVEIKLNAETAPLDVLQQQPLLAFPRGAESGIFIHSLLEHLDFSTPLADQQSRIAHLLALYGFDQEWVPALSTAMTAVLQAPLNDTLSLHQLDPGHCFKEWDFDLKLPGFNRSDLTLVYDTYAPDSRHHSAQAKASPSYLTGSIDLLFCHEGRYFIADYKSNDLGQQLNDYAPEALESNMQHHQYFLQFTLYTLALHRYLTVSLPDYDYATHFGGVYYLFLRGMHPEHPGNGVYFHRPEADLIATLTERWSAS